MASETEAAPDRRLRQMIRDFGILALANVGSQAIGFVALTIFARKVGPSGVGIFTFASTTIAFVGLVVNLGLPYTGIRDIAQGRDSPAKIASEVTLAQVALALLAYVALLIVVQFAIADSVTRDVFEIYALTLLVTGVTFDWACLALRLSRSIAGARILGQVLYAAALAALMHGARRHEILVFAAANVAGVGLTALVTCGIWRRNVFPALQRVSLREAGSRVRRSALLGYSIAMILAYNQADVVMLHVYRSSRAVGLYGVAAKLPLAGIVLVNVWLNAFFPYASAALKDDPGRFRRELGKLVAIALGAMLGVGALCIAGGGSLMSFLFGQQFAAAGTPFIYLALAAGVVVVTATFHNTLLAAHGERLFALGMTGGAVVNIGLNFILIPGLGVNGAAIDTLVAEVFVAAFMASAVFRRVGPIPVDFGAVALDGLAAGASAFVVVRLDGTLATPVPLAVGAVFFVSLAVFWRTLRPSSSPI